MCLDVSRDVEVEGLVVTMKDRLQREILGFRQHLGYHPLGRESKRLSLVLRCIDPEICLAYITTGLPFAPYLARDQLALARADLGARSAIIKHRHHRDPACSGAG